MEVLQSLYVQLMGTPDRVVPPTGFTARLTLLSAASMAFLAVFAMALSLSTGRLADRWSGDLARTASVRISAPLEQREAQVNAALRVLAQTPGVASARAIEADEAKALLAPWFGVDLPLDSLPIPQMIEVVATGDGYDAEGLRLRLSAEAPGAVFDDHTRWREPLVQAAERIRLFGLLSLGLILGLTGMVITLAANAALAANAQVIRVLRLVGATDRYIARAFVRRFAMRAVNGAAIGSAFAMILIALMPGFGAQLGENASFLSGLGFAGWSWFYPIFVPPLAGLVAYAATRRAAFKVLKEVM